VPTSAPSRYIDWLVGAAASTTWCHLPSATMAVLTIWLTPPVQNSPYSLPLVPTYSAGT